MLIICFILAYFWVVFFFGVFSAIRTGPNKFIPLWAMNFYLISIIFWPIFFPIFCFYHLFLCIFTAGLRFGRI